MVISFSYDPVFRFLDETGYVATFRTQRRKRPNCNTWANRGRGEAKEFDVRVSEVGQFDPFETATPMTDLAGASGLGGIDGWRDAIEDVHGGDVTGWVYFVTKLGDSDD